MKRFFKVSAFFLVMIIIGMSFLAMFYYYYRDNVHVILPGQYYRSAQLDSADLVRMIRQKHLRSVIDLRIKERDVSAYQREKKITKDFDVKFYYFPMYAYRLPNKSELRKLTGLLDNVPKPVLIHCGGGADRSGLAAAIVLLLHNFSLEKAKKQISIKYFVISSKSVGKLVLPHYANWLKKKKEKSSRELFLQWVYQTE